MKITDEWWLILSLTALAITGFMTGCSKQAVTPVEPRIEYVEKVVEKPYAVKPKYTEGDEITVVASAYSAGDGHTPGKITSMGAIVSRGAVAVDPLIIPLGSLLWIEDYGYCIALDTGGAIKGNRVDLYMDSITEAKEWGKRSVKLKIIQIAMRK